MTTTHADIYTRVTGQIISAIEQGAGTFRMPWHRTGNDCFLPTNAASQRPYRGLNVLTLWAAADRREYTSGIWATYKQWQNLGAQVRQGEKSTLVVLWKPTERRDEDDPEQKVKRRQGLLARGYSVFNVAQVDGYSEAERDWTPLSDVERSARAETFFGELGADIRHGGGRAFYDLTNDRIQLPVFGDFHSGAAYYSTLAHEVTHWTGAAHRLKRELGRRFGSDAYAAEELVAELGAAFLCGALDFATQPRADHAAYIAAWLRVLKSDNRAIFTAASKAQQAADWLMQQSECTTVAAAAGV